MSRIVVRIIRIGPILVNLRWRECMGSELGKKLGRVKLIV